MSGSGHGSGNGNGSGSGNGNGSGSGNCKCDCKCPGCGCEVVGVDPDGWSDGLESMLLDWQDDAMGYIYIHQHSAKHYRFWHRLLMVTSILLVSVGGLGAMFVEAYKAKWPVFMFAGFGIVGAFLAGIDEKFDLSALAARHDEARKSFTSLPRKIQLELRKTRSHRKDADTFTDGIEELFAQVQKEAPEPLEKHVRMWISLKARSGVKRIDTYSQIQLYRNTMGTTSSSHATRQAVRQQLPIPRPVVRTQSDPVGLEPIDESAREKFTVDRDDVVGTTSAHRRAMFSIEDTYRDILRRDPALLPNKLPNKVLVDDSDHLVDPVEYLRTVYTAPQTV